MEETTLIETCTEQEACVLVDAMQSIWKYYSYTITMLSPHTAKIDCNFHGDRAAHVVVAANLALRAIRNYQKGYGEK